MGVPEQSDTPEYRFAGLPREVRPPAVQYTPEYDPDWVYPTGAKAGGTRDDVPVQGLELGVLSRVTTLQTAVETVLRGLESYHASAGEYPRHRVVVDTDSFLAQADGETGLVATLQPRPTDHGGLTDHFRALEESPDRELLVSPNYERALRLAVHLAGAFAARGPRLATTDARPPGQFRQIADTPVLERYAPLGASSLYDLTGGSVEFDDPDAERPAELSFAPEPLGIDTRPTLETTAWYVTSAEEPLGIVARG
jgi:hypothetical protein